MKEIKIRIPATSANLGPGFDFLGIAWKKYNTASFTFFDRPLREEDICEKDQYFWDGYQALGNYLKRDLPFMHVSCQGDVPPARGLGSSVICYLAGVMAADWILGGEKNRDIWLALTSQLEGHPDNAAPAVFGALQMTGKDGLRIKGIIHPSLRFYLAIPEFSLKTRTSRGVLPDSVPFSVCSANMQAIVFLLKGLETGEESFLRRGLKDLLHEPYRIPLIKGAKEILSMGMKKGAIGGVLSGSGPTLLFVSKKPLVFDHCPSWHFEEVFPDEEGCKYLI